LRNLKIWFYERKNIKHLAIKIFEDS